jgi:5-methylcytosine-specific restriction endonuclease McrA
MIGERYHFDLWPVIEKWYREKYGMNGRLGFLHAKHVREWLGINGYDSHMRSDELLYYAPRWSTLRDYIVFTHGTTCEVCGKNVSSKYGGDEAEIDHIKPIALGGPEFDINNLRVTCKECNTKNRPNKTRRLYVDPKQAKLTKEAQA